MRAAGNTSIFITGSNSKLLANELSTVLSGRYVSFKINPLSHVEYCELTAKPLLSEETFGDFFRWGSLPYTGQLTQERDIKAYLRSVFDSIILRDVVERLQLRDVYLLNLIIQYIVSTIGREFSADNVIKALSVARENLSTGTLYLYIEALCSALLINRVYRYDIKGKAVLKTLYKFYLTDLGIGQIKQYSSGIDIAFGLENVVYNKLLIRGYDVYSGKSAKREIDFVAYKEGKPVTFRFLIC